MVFICEARKSHIRKKELVTRNKALFLRLWKGVNHLILRKQSENKVEALNRLANNSQAFKVKGQLKIAHFKFLSLLFKQKLRETFETLKHNPINFSKRATLYFSSLERMFRTKLLAGKIKAF